MREGEGGGGEGGGAKEGKKGKNIKDHRPGTCCPSYKTCRRCLSAVVGRTRSV